MKLTLAVTSLLCCALTACGTGAPEETTTTENVLALVRTADGAEVRFFESPPGELNLESTPAAGGEDPLARPDLGHLRATEVYEALAGEPAPEALVAAEARAALSEGSGETGELAPVGEGDAALVAVPIGATDFQRRFCGSLSFCWVNRSTDLRDEEFAKGIKGYIYAVRGSVFFGIRRRENGWYQVISRQILPEAALPYHFDEHWGDLIRRKIKIEVKNSTGDQYHLAYDWISRRGW
ncbi:hypothetical protein [Polyangium mundeleinium]|uniref:Lipoprotein n=1 Tax=Polyangium mundeleinium TaxID=2995306 RepID=A0ABT5EQ55_9BACT|nr:hypothetical protein [Polyangium mundeleinium]MDC0743589.1 hypothetical protein [Polyangium mundeleinium]